MKDTISSQFSMKSQCKRYGLSLWQCPQFLFLIMGIIIIAATLAAYFVGERYISDPLMVALLIIFLTIILFVISFIITQGFERLAEANRMKSEFISIVSHQLRSPLTNLRWTLDFLISENAEQKRFEYYNILKENSIRMGELIDNLLVVSRMEQGKFPIKKEEVSLEDFTKKIVKDAEQFAIAANIKIEFNVEKDLPKAFADPTQLKLLIDNLVSNAIRYTKGPGSVRIDLSKAGDKFIFKIIDDGLGIPKKDQKYIFQKFFRAQNAQLHQTQGSGLGLYIAKSVAESMRGKIGFESDENKGSIFWFTIPVK
jgi:signal transduction histidine kinase